MSDPSAADVGAPTVAPEETPKKDMREQPLERKGAAGTAPAAAERSSAIEPGPAFEVRVFPIFVVILLAVFLQKVFLPSLITDFLSVRVRLPLFGARLPQEFANSAVMLALALAAIWLLKRRVAADYGLHWPRERTYLVPALLWGLGLGVAMAAIDYAVHLSALTPFTLNFPLTRSNLIGWIWYQSAFVGPSEEITYRALLVTYLATAMPGKLRFRGYDMNVAGLVVAAILVLIDSVSTFITQPFALGLAREVCIFLIGSVCAYWLEKSKSVVAPIVGHSIAAGLNQAIVLAAVMRWG